jgi:hypothetical protein
MTKPILIVKFPHSYSPELGHNISKRISERPQLSQDYHVFVIPNMIDDFEFKVFNGEYTDIEYQNISDFIEELKK